MVGGLSARRYAAALSAILALLLLAWPAGARADGDPASDVLLSSSVFLPTDTPAPASQQTDLTQLLGRAKRAGFPIRVAVIPTAYDLGSVTPLWRKPSTYAHFLGIELSDVYTGPLLVVMPNGFGFYWPGHSASASDQALAGVAGGSGLVAEAQAAVVRLAAQHGIRLSSSSTAAAKASGSAEDPVWIVLTALAVALIAFALTRVLLRRRARRRAEPRPVRAARLRRPIPGYVLWALPAVLVLGVIVLAAPLALHLGHKNTSALAAQSAPFTWPRDQRRAPAFRLRDQAGQPVSLSAYRGKPVIVTFIDPLCRNLCPLAAQVLDQADRELPPSQRVPIVAVSIDIYADSRADLEEDYSRWRLVPEWQWAVGQPRELATVWRDYKVGVSVVTKRLAGTTIHEITHDEVAYVIDPEGYERALFVWPYYPQDVLSELRALARE